MPQTRRSFWTRTFAAARESGGWYRVNRHYTRATAVQVTSDISCAHTRSPDRHRMRGMFVGEQWEARWEPAVDGAPSDLVVWIRLVAVDGVELVRRIAVPDGAAADGAGHDGARRDGAGRDGVGPYVVVQNGAAQNGAVQNGAVQNGALHRAAHDGAGAPG